MSRPLFSDNDAWEASTIEAESNIIRLLESALAELEEDGPVNLHDFHYLVSSSVHRIVCTHRIRRRLSAK